ncbi:ferredoxin--NADP reductase [Rufibacter quisquiliarum]|uniref:Ring-1,2-phenylacetyl-CoA epoxidase subunit PaaE n=1 Tax=Rufibacter quisquiliarum TaxID=1549639 RepID=A0A839G8N6_9BACT|nr:ferredoxin--NADP reductase [Rufibacter quisquiliarum]MBA9075804.1 ring-1,2-phenylacetyl-CoA epoxidase subunit PaaE [Rufibacter quisquiliarum]
MSNAYFTMKVADITQETADALTLHLEHPDKNNIPFIPGQFLTLILPINGQKVRRSYSLCSTPDEPYFSVTVKRVEGGLVSNYVADHVKVGQEIEVMAPLGNFNIKADPNQKRHLFFFGGGSGITPLMSMTKSVLKEEPQSRITLVYGNRNLNSIIFKDALAQLEQQYPERFKIVHVFNESIADATEPQENIGLLDRTMVLQLLENLKVEGFSQESYYMCGPEGMMNEVREALQFMRVPADCIFKESFTAPTTTEDHGADVGASDSDEIITRTVTIIYEGDEYQVEVKPTETILEAGLKADIDLPYSCQAGLCTACRGKCLSGRVHLDEREGLSDAEIDQGYVLNCVGHPLTANVVIEIG